MAMQLQNMERLGFLLLGKTGSGKSSTGNSILGYRRFKTSSSTTSLTSNIERSHVEFNGHLIKVVDGPGLQDTRFTRAQNAENACTFLADAIMQFDNDLTAFLLTYKYGTRCTEEELRTFQDLKRIFGDDYLRKYGVIVVTGGDEFQRNLDDDEEEDHPETFMEWCEQENAALGGLFAECGYRCVLFDNKTRDAEKKERQLDELIGMAGRILDSGERYTSESFRAIAQQRDIFIAEERLLHLQEEFQIRVDLIEKAVYNVSNTPSQHTTEILIQKTQELLDHIAVQPEMTSGLQNLQALARRMKDAAVSLHETLGLAVPDEVTKNALLDQIDDLWKKMKTNQEIPRNLYVKILMYGGLTLLGVLGIAGFAWLGGPALIAGAVSAGVDAAAVGIMSSPIVNTARTIIEGIAASGVTETASALANSPAVTAIRSALMEAVRTVGTWAGTSASASGAVPTTVTITERIIRVRTITDTITRLRQVSSV